MKRVSLSISNLFFPIEILDWTKHIANGNICTSLQREAGMGCILTAPMGYLTLLVGFLLKTVNKMNSTQIKVSRVNRLVITKCRSDFMFWKWKKAALVNINLKATQKII